MDRASYGPDFLNIVQIKTHHLMRHMVASLVLDRQVEALSENALATIMQEKHNYSDAFT